MRMAGSSTDIEAKPGRRKPSPAPPAAPPAPAASARGAPPAGRGTPLSPSPTTPACSVASDLNSQILAAC
uniref:Uncharacterized protein n=1 Tax=Oryza brachyantha TaxID=4533 RepID=J3NC73_ORYBR